MTASAPLPECPRLAPWYRRVEEGSRIVFEHGGRAVVLEGAAVGRLLPPLLPLLDGTRTPDEVVETLGRPVAPAVERALDLLAAGGLLTDGPPPPGSPEASETAEHLAAASGAAPSAVAGRLASARIAVAGTSPISAEVVRLLDRAGVGHVARRSEAAPDPSQGLAVVAPAAEETDLLAAWNEAAIPVGAPWLPVVPGPDGLIVIGPLVLPRRTACLACSGPPPRRPTEPAPLRAAAAAAVAVEHALRWVALADPRLPGVRHLLAAAGAAVGLRAELVQRRPRCPVCSDALVRANALPWHEAA